MVWSPCALGTRTELLWFGHGCSGHCMLSEHERSYGLGMDALDTVCSWNANGITVWAGWSGHRMKLEHERNFDLGMDALVTVFSWNMNGVMARAWMLWSLYALGTRTELRFGHGCSGHSMLWSRIHSSSFSRCTASVCVLRSCATVDVQQSRWPHVMETKSSTVIRVRLR